MNNNMMNVNKTEIEIVGKVEDLPSDESFGWVIYQGEIDGVLDKLSSEGFDDAEIDTFGAFLVKTESGDYTDIYGIKGTIPYLWLDAYRFKVNGVYL